MNIFFLSTDPVEAAQMMCDKHVVKLILELCQMLWTAFHLTGYDYWKEYVPDNIQVYKATHANHPMCVWVRSSQANYIWSAQHAVAIGHEYTRRYNKIHKCQIIVEWLLENIPLCNETIKTKAVYSKTDLPVIPDYDIQCTYPPITIKDSKYHKDSLIESYREYYIGDKVRFAKWKLGNIPEWFLKE